MKQQLFQLLTEFQAWQNGQALSEVRLVQHELVLAHLARLYGGLAWNAQHFGLCPSYPLLVDIQEEGPVALTELLAVTATGKLLVCAQAEIPECENPIENNGLFAIARPLPIPKALRETLPDFPLYQVQLEWRAWQAGIDELVKTGEGLPLGRFNNGQWDVNYIPPVMSLATDQILSQQAAEVMSRVDKLARCDSQVADLVVALGQTDWTIETPWAFWQAHCSCLVALKDHPKLAEDSAYHAKVSELVSWEFWCWEMAASLVLLGSVWEAIEKRFDKESARQKSMAQLMKRVDKLASRDSQVADLVVPLGQMDWTTATPRAFWQSHCRCLLALKDHPKLADDLDYQDCVSTLLSATFSLSMFGDGLEPLRFAWRRVEQGLEKPAKRPPRYVSLGWYATSLVALALVAVLLGMDLVYQSDKSMIELKAAFENQLAALDNKQSERLTTLDNKQAQTAQALRTELAALDNKQAQTAQALRTELAALDNEHVQKAGELSNNITAVDNKHVQKAGDLSKRVTKVDDKLVQTADKLSKDITALDNKQAETAGDLSKRLTVLGNKQAQTADDLSNNIIAVDNEHDKKADELSKQLTALDNKQAQTADDLSKRLSVLGNKQAQTADELSKRLTVLDNEHVQKAGELSKDITAVDNEHDEKAAEFSKRLTSLDNKQAQTADDLSKRLSVLGNKQAQTADELSKQLAEVDDKHVQTADKLSNNITAVDNEHDEKADELSKQLTTLDNKQAQTADNLSNKLTMLSNKQAQTADELSKDITAVDNEHDEKADNLSKRVTKVDNKHVQRADELSKRLTKVDNKHVQKAGYLSKRLTKVDNKHVQKAGYLFKRLTELNEKQAQTAQTLRTELAAVDDKHVQKAAELSKRVTEVDNTIDWLIPPGKVVFQDRLKDGTLGPKMLVIPAGKFRMGDIQGGGESNEQPVHEVSIKSFAMGRYEVTFAEYDKFAEATGRTKPSDKGWGRGNRPVINVSWHDATAYAKWLTEQTGHQYRLPTEAEWEYAARAGTETKYWWGNDIGKNRAACDGCGAKWGWDAKRMTAPVGSFKPNPFGLYDTAGNVWEWTCSEYEGRYTGKEQRCAKSAGRFAVRGASWFIEAWRARSANRYRGTPTNRNGNYGVRLVRMQ
jgi:formylglycine-generating enzyme required for sulfatase activity/DNA anti-recombination protein RmuC